MNLDDHLRGCKTSMYPQLLARAAAYVAPVVHSASAAAERWAYGAAERAAAAAAAAAAPSVPRRGAPYADWMPR